MAEEAIDYENMPEEDLARARGDYYGEEAQEANTAGDAPAEESTETSSATEDAGKEGDATTNSGGDDGDGRPSDEGAVSDTDDEGESNVKPLMMPKSRYDSAMARLREQEARVQELEARLNQQAQTQQPTQREPTPEEALAWVDGQIAEAVKDGNAEKVVELMQQSRNIQNYIWNQQIQSTKTEATSTTLEQLKYDKLLGEAEAKIGAINPDSDLYDEAVVDEVADLASAYETRGMAPSQALQKALDVLKPQGWVDAPAPAPAPQPEARKTDVKKNVETAKQQPPTMDAGRNSDTAGVIDGIDIMKLSEEDFEKLTEEQLAKLRGDFA